jgi:pimeloyl-ACP methyl ester carboxylesterase
MKVILSFLSVILAAQLSWGQSQPIKTTYVKIGASNALLMEPVTPGPKSHIALVYTYPGTSLSLSTEVNNFNHPSGPQLAGRGYRELLLNHSLTGPKIGYESIAPAIGQAIKYARSLPGVDTVLLMSHSIGGPLAAFYENVAENGPKACQGPQKIYPCRGDLLKDLPRADGVIFTDSHLGEAFRLLTYLDPAVADEMHPLKRNSALDMFDPTNGYEKKEAATYNQDFLKNFFTSQAARNERLVSDARARLAAITKGQGKYKQDEPFEVPEANARALQSDTRLISHSRNDHPLLKSDGTTVKQVIQSVRPTMGQENNIGGYELYTVRGFLAGEAIRTTADYMMTENSITGVDWASSTNSAPSNIEGIKVPVLIMSMTCHYFVVPNEILFDHAVSKDKQLVYVEGASHGYTPCRPEYGDTMKHTFDYIDSWLSEGKRFSSQAN